MAVPSPTGDGSGRPQGENPRIRSRGRAVSATPARPTVGNTVCPHGRGCMESVQALQNGRAVRKRAPRFALHCPGARDGTRQSESEPDAGAQCLGAAAVGWTEEAGHDSPMGGGRCRNGIACAGCAASLPRHCTTSRDWRRSAGARGLAGCAQARARTDGPPASATGMEGRGRLRIGPFIPGERLAIVDANDGQRHPTCRRSRVTSNERDACWPI